MAKVVVADVTAKRRKGRSRAVTKRRVRGADGEFSSQFWVDGFSVTLDDDLTRVFQANVARARLQNERILGSPDGFRKSAKGAAAKFAKLLGSIDGNQKK